MCPSFSLYFKQLKPGLEYDDLFANKMKQRNVVLGYYFKRRRKNTSCVCRPCARSGTFKGRPINFTQWAGYGANLEEFQTSAISAGHFNPVVDFDGVVRRIPMIAEYEGAYYESLSLAIVRTLLGFPKLVPGFATDAKNKDYAGLEWLELNLPQGSLRIPVDSEVSTLVPYQGARGAFKYISVADVLNGQVPVSDLQSKIILVGTTTPGLLDLRSTPVDEVYPGVEIHANMVSGMLSHTIKSNPPYVVGVEVMLLLVVGGALCFLLPLLTPVQVTIVTAVALLVSVVGNGLLWQYANFAVPIASGLLMIMVLFALNMSYGYFFVTRTKKQITDLFGQYVPKEVVGELSERPQQVSMEGDSREMTILFSDVRGFTTISEKLNDPKKLSLLMNAFLTPLSRIVYKYRGTIDKYMGDCIMAFWGAPLPDDRHAHNSIVAGLEMLKTLESLQPEFEQKGWPPIHIGVGINTGRVSVGNMGSEVRVAYTVMGDAVNLASRLEGITKEYGVGIVVGENTKAAAPDFIYRELDLVRVKGKDEPVAIFEPIGISGTVEEAVVEEMKLFHRVLRSYRKQEWDKVELQLFNLQKMSPDTKLYQVYAERVVYFRNNPPEADWDGVFVFKTK